MARQTLRDLQSSFVHLTRVRMGVNGPKGRLMRCDGNRGVFWKVKLDGCNEWMWPDAPGHEMIIDGPGAGVARCVDCELSYMTDGKSPKCPSCDKRSFGKPAEIRRPNAYLAGARMSAPPVTIRDLTPEEEQAEIARRKRESEATPF